MERGLPITQTNDRASKNLEQWLGVTQLGVHSLVVRLVTRASGP